MQQHTWNNITQKEKPLWRGIIFPDFQLLAHIVPQ